MTTALITFIAFAMGLGTGVFFTLLPQHPRREEGPKCSRKNPCPQCRYWDEQANSAEFIAATLADDTPAPFPIGSRLG